MSRANKVRYERRTISLTPEALAFIKACKKATMKDQDAIAQGLATASKSGNASATKMLFTLCSISPPRPAEEEEEPPCAKTFALWREEPSFNDNTPTDAPAVANEDEDASQHQLEELELEEHELEVHELELTAC